MNVTKFDMHSTSCQKKFPHDLHSTDCQKMSQVLARIGEKWSVLIIMLLAGGRTDSPKSSVLSMVFRSEC